VSDFIPLSVPSIQGNEWKYVKECLDTEWVSSVGSYVDLFEEKICEYVGSANAVACVNGTAALHIALIVAGVRSGDEVIVPTVTFIAPINAVRYVGAQPIFMDCDACYNIDPEKTIEFIRNETDVRKDGTYNRKTGARISAIIPVHAFGNAVAMDDLLAICDERDIIVIEDATESLGTFYTGEEKRYTGTVGDIGVYSFNGNKIITSGGGGMLVTDDAEWAQRARYFTTQAKDDEIRYVHSEIGFNYRLTNIQAAVGVAQLEQLDEYLDIKRENFVNYVTEIARIPGLSIAPTPQYATNNHWFYCLEIDSEEYGTDPDGVREYLAGHGVQTRPIWELNHLQAPYRNAQNYRIELAPQKHARTLNVPCSVTLTETDIIRIANLLRDRPQD